MTRSHHDHPPRSASGAARGAPPPPELAGRIAAELAALGEDPADDDELALAAEARGVDESEAVRTVATLVALSTWAPPAKAQALDRQRVWQRVLQRVGTSVAAPVVDPDHAAPAANGGGLRGVLASLALVAGVALVLRVDVGPPPSAEERAELEIMGQATRAALEAAAPGERDGARARALAEGYAERLRAERGAEP
jgi:hypothetical protein